MYVQFTSCVYGDTLKISTHFQSAPLHKKVKYFIKDFFGKCDQIGRKLRIWSHLLDKSLMENFIFVQWTPMQLASS